MENKKLDDVLEEAKDLIEEGEALIAKGSPMQVDDMMPWVRDHLFAESQAVLA